MKKNLLLLAALVPLCLLALAAYNVLSAPPEPPFGAANRDAVIARLDHLFLTAAYAMTWAIQLGYLVWLGFKRREQKQEESRAKRSLR